MKGKTGLCPFCGCPITEDQSVVFDFDADGYLHVWCDGIKHVYNKFGLDAGEVVGREEYNGIDCLVVDNKRSSKELVRQYGIGKYWEISRIDNGKDDEITVK